MTTAPVTPADFKNVIITPTATFCLAFVKLFIRFPILVYNLVNFMLNADGTINENKFLRQIFNPGDLKLSASTVTPVGFKLCDGSAISRGDYAELFAAVGSTYGDGDGSTTFNIPDYRGRFPVGVGTIAGLLDRDGGAISGTTYALGNKGGEEKVVLITAENAKHKHQMFGEDTSGGSKVPNAVEAVYRQNTGGQPSDYKMIAYPDSDTTAPTVGPTSMVGGDGTTDKATEGKGTGHNNLPPYVACYYYIKT